MFRAHFGRPKRLIYIEERYRGKGKHANRIQSGNWARSSIYAISIARQIGCFPRADAASAERERLQAGRIADHAGVRGPLPSPTMGLPCPAAPFQLAERPGRNDEDDSVGARQTIELKTLDERLHEWGLPKYQTDMSAGIDLHACIAESLQLEPQAPAVLIPSGIALLMNDPNMVGFLLARSGLGHKKGLILGQSVGTIDADYTNEIFISAWLRTPPGSEPLTINPGDRIAQLVFVPILRPDFRVVSEFSSSTARGLGGFGS